MLSAENSMYLSVLFSPLDRQENSVNTNELQCVYDHCRDEGSIPFTRSNYANPIDSVGYANSTKKQCSDNVPEVRK